MRRTLEVRRRIPASAERVWDLLADLASYPRWNPLIVAASGTLREAEELSISLRFPGDTPTPYRVRITRLDEGNELWWLGHFKLPGLIDGHHGFIIEPRSPNESILIQREHFSGLLVPFVYRTHLNRELRWAFERLADAATAHLAARCPDRQVVTPGTPSLTSCRSDEMHGVSIPADVPRERRHGPCK